LPAAVRLGTLRPRSRRHQVLNNQVPKILRRTNL
jgi:hypothetical protein